MAKLFVPVSMRYLTRDARVIEATGNTLGEIINDADARYPGLKSALVPDGVKLKPGWTAICGEYPARYGLRETVEDGMEIHFVPAISGGKN